MERLLRVRRVDAYAILGLRADCSETDIYRHYNKLQSLLSVEKTPMEGMDEAESLIETAFALIQSAECREDYSINNLGNISMVCSYFQHKSCSAQRSVGLVGHVQDED